MSEIKTFMVIIMALLSAILAVLVWTLIITPEWKAYQTREEMRDLCKAGNTVACQFI